MTDAAQIARGLSKAQRKALTGGLHKALWTTIKALRRQRLVLIRTCFPDGDGLRITPLGLAVRAELEKMDG